MAESWQLALLLSGRLVSASSFESYFSTVAGVLQAVLPGDSLLWTSLNLAAGTASVSRAGRGDDAALPPGLVAGGADHPGVLSYLARPHDFAPCRMRAVTDKAGWRASACNELFRDGAARYQLSMVVAPGAPAEGHGWIIGRRSHDFSDEEVDLARHLLPVLALGWAHLSRSAPPSPDPGIQPVLSPRERHALELLATGCTATAMARRMNVSPRTARKHLENLYNKMDVHDRLMAVERARALGMLT